MWHYFTLELQSPTWTKPILTDIKKEPEDVKIEPKDVKIEPKEEEKFDVKLKQLSIDVEKGHPMEQRTANSKLLDMISQLREQIAEKNKKISEQAEQINDKDKQIVKYQQMQG